MEAEALDGHSQRRAVANPAEYLLNGLDGARCHHPRRIKTLQSGSSTKPPPSCVAAKEIEVNRRPW